MAIDEASHDQIAAVIMNVDAGMAAEEIIRSAKLDDDAVFDDQRTVRFEVNGVVDGHKERIIPEGQKLSAYGKTRRWIGHDTGLDKKRPAPDFAGAGLSPLEHDP
jgi:hypothetical protein